MSTQAVSSDHETDTEIPEYISRTRLVALTGLSDTTIWRCVRRGELPAPVRLTPGRVAWKAATVRQWLAERETSKKVEV